MANGAIKKVLFIQKIIGLLFIVTIYISKLINHFKINNELVNELVNGLLIELLIELVN